jgi:hypothetical protein
MTSPERIFTQRDYNQLIDALDTAMSVLLSFNKSEDDAKKWLADFLLTHYLRAWRRTSEDAE